MAMRVWVGASLPRVHFRRIDGRWGCEWTRETVKPLNYPDAGDPCLKDGNGNLGKFKEHKTL